MYSNVNSCGVGCIALCVTWLNVLTIFLYIYCILCFLYVWSECYWKRYSKNPPFWMWFCLFLFILSSIFQSYVLLPFLNFDVYIFVKGASHYNHENSLFNSICVEFSSAQLLSCIWLFATPWTAARQAALSITKSQSLPKLMSIESGMPSSNLILCHPLLLLPPNISQHWGLLKWVSSSHEVAKVLELQLQHQSF